MDDFNSDLVLQIVQFLNVVDNGRLAVCAQRYYYLVHQYRKLRGPELITVSSWDRSTFQQRPATNVASEPIAKLQKAPNLVLAFNTPRGTTLEEELPRNLPPNAVVLGACAPSIQVNLGAGNVECKSNASAMYASFPDADILPFCLDYGDTANDRNMESLQKSIATAMSADENYWKAVIVYASGHGSALIEDFVTSIQSLLPNAAIVGGICNDGYISQPMHTKAELRQMTVRQLRKINATLGGPANLTVVEKSELVDHVHNLQETSGKVTLLSADDSVFGVVLGGEAPVKSMVSRGVTSTLHGKPQSTSPYVVRDATLARPDDPDFIFQGSDLKPIHMIRSIYNRDTGATMTAMALMAQTMNDAEFIGVKRSNEDGFELHMLSPYSQAAQSYLIMTDGSDAQLQSLDNAEIDFFALNGEACCEDMELTVSKLKEQTQGDQILGAVMYSCSGRGPHAGSLIRQEMADATRFANVFPDVPCLGYYAGGEVGPLALAGNEKVFQTGKASVQGFTAVFCLFIVPVVGSRKYQLDDCRDNVVLFVQSRLSTTAAVST